MKKFFLALVALCSMALAAQAAMPEGLVISICGTNLNQYNYKNVYVQGLSRGFISYDEETNVLYVHNVYLNSSNSYPAIYIGGTTEQPVKVVFTDKCEIFNGSSGNGLEFDCPVELTTVEGCSVEVKALYAAALELSADMSVTNGAYIDLTGTTYGAIGKEQDGNYPTIRVDCASLNFSTFGSGEGAKDIADVICTHSYLPDGMTWSTEHRCAWKEEVEWLDNIVINREDGYYFFGVGCTDANGVPLFGKGKVTLYVDGQEVPNPYRHQGEVDVTVKVEDTEDYWYDMMHRESPYEGTYNSEATWTAAADKNDLILVECERYLHSDSTWYIMKDCNLIKSYNHLGSADLVGEVPGLADAYFYTGTALMWGSAPFFFYATKTPSNKAAVGSILVDLKDPSKSIGPTENIAPQDDYFPLYAAACSPIDDQIYFCGKKKNTSDTYLLRLNGTLDGLEEVQYLGNKPITAMTIGADGVLYMIQEDEKNASWVAMAPFDLGAGTFFWPIMEGKTGVPSSNASAMNSIGMDPFTKELIWLQADADGAKAVRVIDPTSGLSYYSSLQKLNARGMFQMLKMQTVTLKSSDESKGRAHFYGLSKSEAFFPVGSEVQIYADPSKYYRFVQWDDGNTDNPRTITVSDEWKAYTASFDWEEDIELYSIEVGGVQLHNKRTMVYPSDGIGLIDGNIFYNAEENVLTLKNLNVNTNDVGFLRVGKQGSGLRDITIRLEGENKIKNDAGVYFTIKLEDLGEVRMEGTGSLQITCGNTALLLSDETSLTIDDVNLEITAGVNGILGFDNEKVKVRGSNVSVKGVSDGSIAGLAAFDLEFCSITSPSGATFNPETYQVEVTEGTPTKDLVQITSWPVVRCEPEDEGSGHFVLRGPNDEAFTNTGWFEPGTDITITAVPKDGFEFARWAEDPSWGDKEKENDWWGDVLERTVNSDLSLKAIFYYTPKSTATWYAVHDAEYISFSLTDRAAEVAKASEPYAISVWAGDYHDGQFDYYTYPKTFSTMPFDGISDGEPLSGKENIETLFEQDLNVYDMSYDLKNKIMYAIVGGDLYRVEEGDDTKLVRLGSFKLGDDYRTGRSLAVDAKGAIYVMAIYSDEAYLYKVEEIDEEAEIVKIEPVGDNKGKVGKKLTSTKQCIAFDHATGELFWGAEDYIRKFDLQTGRGYVCADLGMNKGGLNYLYAMHRMSKFVKVTVKLAEDCEGMGTVSADDIGYGAGKYLAGQKATITAKANSGYKFLYWQKKNTTKEIENSTYSFTVSGAVTYYAYFKKEKQGVEEVMEDGLPVTGKKVLIDGQLYIIQGDKLYNATGNRVK